MDDLAIARALHVLAIVLWIGGVAMVTTVLLPAVKKFKTAEERLAFFEAVERRFAWQARGTTLLAGASGFYMVDRLGQWTSILSLQSWWLPAMVGIWSIFTILLFVAEPLFLVRWLEKRARREPDRTYALVQRLHWILLAASLITLLGAVAGSHGLAFFG